MAVALAPVSWSAPGPPAALVAGGSDGFFDSAFDGVWVGTIELKGTAGRRSYPLLLNIDVSSDGARGYALVPDGFSGAPGAMAFRSVAQGLVKGRKIDLTVTLVQGSTRLLLRAKSGRLRGKATFSTSGIGKGRVELRPLDPQAPLQQVWVGEVSAGRRTGRAQATPVALALVQQGALTGAGFVGDAFGTLRGVTAIGGRVTGTLATDAGDFALDLLLQDTRLQGRIDGAGLGGETTLYAGGLVQGPPVLKKTRAPPLPAGKFGTVTLQGRNLTAGFLVHVNHAGAYAETPRVLSSRKATVAVFVPADLPAGTQLALRLVAPAGSPIDASRPLTVAPPTAVSYNEDILPVFAGTCAQLGCHATPPLDDPVYGGQEPAGGLALDPNVAYGNVVNRPSTEVPSLDRVEPGDPEHSYLYLKITGAPGIVGDRMPQGGPFLSDAVIALFERWIREGALPN